MAKGKHPWPTDGVTKRNLDREIDRMERLWNRNKELWRETGKIIDILKVRIAVMEGILEQLRNRENR